MEPIDPVFGTTTLLLIAAAAVALLLVLIIKVGLHAFVALVLVSVLTALAVGFEPAEIPDALTYGFADTLGSVALLVAFGVMLGRLLEFSGGAQVLADRLISRFGENRAPFALGLAALLFGFPIFFDAGLVIFFPIVLTVARRFGGSLLSYVLPAAGAFAAMHAVTPPHPGPVAAAGQLGADVGLTLLIGLPVVAVSWYVGVMLVSRVLAARYEIAVTDAVFGQVRDTAGTARSGDGAGDGAGSGAGTGATVDRADDLGRPAPPSFGAVLGLLLVPLVLISFDTVLDTLGTAGVVDPEAGWVAALQLLGQTSVALLITVLAAIVVLGRSRATMSEVGSMFDEALGPVCSVILITGAGGMFGGILELSGIGAALSGSLSDLGFSLIVQAFLISTVLRVAQGSATVAITTTGGLIAASVQEAGLGEVQLVLLVVAIAAGATVLSHVNDSGFWLVGRLSGMDVATTLRTWTVLETTLGVTIFACAAVVWLFV